MASLVEYSRTRVCLASSRRLGSALVAALALVATDARGGDVEVARKRFAEGVRLYQNGDWEGARRLFRDADAEHHAPAIVYNIGLAEEKLGHPQAAVDAYEAYIAEAGESGELASAAAAAIAQIKARSTRLRLETKPAGARVFVDGTALGEPAPVTVLVPAGHHVVVAQGDGWRDERDVEVKGGGDLVSMVLEPKEPAPAAASPVAPREGGPPPAPSVLPDRPIAQAPRVEAPQQGPDELVWAAAFTIMPAYLLGVSNAQASNASTALTIVAGPTLEVGYAVTDRFELLARGFVGIGPDAKPSYAYMGGPALSYRIASPIWIGAGFLGGQLETRAHGARYGTDQVFGAMFEASVVVVKKQTGEWLASVQPSFLLTEMRQDNTAFVFPFSFGYRGF